jgi:hypothetical protein
MAGAGTGSVAVSDDKVDLRGGHANRVRLPPYSNDKRTICPGASVGSR